MDADCPHGESYWLVCNRDNVLFGHAYDEERYWQVLRACALDQDVQHMYDSDLTHVGDRGAALSGGQQARLALARAVYQVFPRIAAEP